MYNNCMLNIAVNSHIFLAHVARKGSLVLPELITSTKAKLSDDILIFLSLQASD